MPWGDVVTGQGGGGTVSPFTPRGGRKPKRAATIKRSPPPPPAASTGGGGWYGAAASRLAFWPTVAYSAWQAQKWLRSPDFDPWGYLREQEEERRRREKEIRDKARRTRDRVAKEREAVKRQEAAALAGEIAAAEVIGARQAPAAPAARFIPGTPEYAAETERQAREARARAVAGAGGTPPYTPAEQIEMARQRGAASAPPPAAAAAQQKKTMQSRAAALLANPLFQVGILGATLIPWGKIAGGKKPKAAPPPEEFIEPPLTEFEPEGVAYGELGGVPAFSEAVEPETETASERCEKIEPKRTPGECRQGWFSETPRGLYLKEWSRRPCQ